MQDIETLMRRLVDARTFHQKATRAYVASASYMAIEAAAEAARQTDAGRLVEGALAEIGHHEAAIKALIGDTKGVNLTAYGKVGWQIAKTYTYNDKAVMDLAPQIYEQVCSMTVDGKGLETKVKGLIKAGLVPDNTFEALQARATFRESSTFILKPTAPVAEVVPA